jgi:hypothetical protein
MPEGYRAERAKGRLHRKSAEKKQNFFVDTAIMGVVLYEILLTSCL